MPTSTDRLRKALLDGSRYRRNLIHGALANAFTQAVPLLVLPVLTRLYQPDDFGILSIYVAAVLILSSLAVFRIDWFVSATRNRFRAVSGLLIGVTLLFATLLLSLIFGVALLSMDAMANVDAFNAIRPFLWLVPIGVAGYSLFLLISAWYVRQARIRALSSSRMMQGIIGAAVSVSFGLLGAGAIGLILGNIANTSAGVAKLFRTASSDLVSAAARIKRNHVSRVALANVGDLAFSGGSSVINACGLYLPTLVFGTFFSAHEVGLLALAQKIASAPTSAIGTAVYQSFWGEAAQARQSQRSGLLRTFQRTSLLLAGLALLLLAFCAAGPLFMGSVFGESSWGSTGLLLAALAPLVATQLVASTLSPVITMLGGARWVFYWDCTRTALIAGCIAACAIHGASFIATVLAYSASMAIMYVALYIKTRSIVIANQTR